MGSTFKLRMKIGVHEFDAEGPAEEVNARFDTWKGLIQQSSAVPRNPNAGIFVSETPLPLRASTEPDHDSATPRSISAFAQRVFAVDDRRNLITLRVHPTGDDDVVAADAVLALVYGYLEMKGMDEVPVTKLTNSVRVSGLRAERMDRAATPHTRSQFLIKTGTGKGGRYSLTTTGRARAEALVKELHDKVA